MFVDRSITICRLTRPDGNDEAVTYKGEIPDDRAAAIRLMTRYVLSALNPQKFDDHFVVPVSERERDAMEAAELFKRARDPEYVGRHTQARNVAIDGLWKQIPDIFTPDNSVYDISQKSLNDYDLAAGPTTQ